MTFPTVQETFENVPVDLVVIGTERWIRGTHIGAALGFADPKKSVKDIYTRNQREFDDSTTLVIEMPTAGGRQLVRLYNSRGAALIAMKAQTPKGEAFRRWVLDVLEGTADTGPVQPGQNIPPTVLNGMVEMFLARKHNVPIVRYRGKDLSAAEIGRLLGVSASYVGKRLRVAEYLGLVEVDPKSQAFRNTPAFLKMIAARNANSARSDAKRRQKALTAPTGETTDAQ
jgi:DNA-binding MarR family transcriptional regulator